MALVEQEADDRLLSFRGVSIRFDTDAVVRDLDVDLTAGQSLLVVGPSGCGKSTWAMLAAGLIPHSVEATVTGAVWRSPRLARPGAIGYVFQDPDSQFCQIRVGEEVAFGLENQALPAEAMPARIEKALTQAHLPAPLGIEHHALSGGNKQKLALAAALALRPDMLILDEPTANLDPAGTAAVFEEITRLSGTGTTVVVIEHKFTELADRIPWMMLMGRDGRVRRLGFTRRLLEEEADWMRAEGILEDLDTAGSRPAQPLAVNTAHPIAAMRAVSARYHRRGPLVLDDVTIAVRPRELVALVGSNGAGKSTFLKVLGGLMKVSSGEVDRPPSDQIGFGFQNPEHQFIFERVADELADRYVDGPLPDEVAALLAEFQLGDEAWKSPYSLSQGQKRRLSVAVMVKRARQLYCLDEPTFGQDAGTRQAIMTRLAARAADGAGVMISTHDLDLVRRYATRVIALDQGRVIFDGTPEDLFARPEVMRRAHLLPLANSDGVAVGQTPVFSLWTDDTRHSLIGRLNPAWKLLTVFVAVGLSAAGGNLGQVVPLALLPIILLMGFSGLGPVKALKRLAPFILFFAMYVWTMTAYAAVGPHTPVVHILWYRLSYPGFVKGLILGLRMLAAVGFGWLFVGTVDLVDVVKSLSREFRVPPKFSYGTLAGLRFFPQFQDEWRKLSLARRVRGRDTRWTVTRIVTYALPLLSDAVRLSERVAIAMEARGFVGAVTESSRSRTYYQASRSGWRDAVFAAAVIGLTAAALWH